MRAYSITWVGPFISHICHFLALNVMSHIPNSLHHPQKCVLSRTDVPYLWTQPSLSVLLGTGVKPGSRCESHSSCLHGPFSQQGHSGIYRKHTYFIYKAWGTDLQTITEKIFGWDISLDSQFPLSLPMFLSDKHISTDTLQNAWYVVGTKYTYILYNCIPYIY